MSISTLGISRRLEANGFTKSQAEGVAEELVEVVENSDLVTKDFLRAEMAASKSDLRTEMAELKSDLRAEMAELKTDLIKWIIGLQFTSLGLMFGLIYFLLRH